MTNLDHIATLQRHGAQLRNPDDGSLIPLTEDFYRRAVEECIRGGYNAVTYELELPGIDADFMIAFWKDGHVDSGTTTRIIECLASR